MTINYQCLETRRTDGKLLTVQSNIYRDNAMERILGDATTDYSSDVRILTAWWHKWRNFQL